MSEDNEQTNLVEINTKEISDLYAQQKKAHVKLFNGQWLNGFILEVRADFFIIDDQVKGEIPVFWLELKYASQFREKKA